MKDPGFSLEPDTKLNKSFCTLLIFDLILFYLQAGLAVFLLPVNRDSLAARNSISLLVSSSVTGGTRAFLSLLDSDRQEIRQ